MATNTRNTEALRARRKAENRARLLDAVERLYREGSPYGELSVERLISEAGLTRSTFYSYYEDKDDLLNDLASTVLDKMLAFWFALPTAASKAQLRTAIDAIIAAYVPHQAIMVAIGEPVPGGAAERAFRTLLERSTTAVTAYIKAGQEEGLVSSDIDARTMAALLMWMTERGLAKLVAPATQAELVVLGEALTEIYWRTLRGGRA